MTTHRHRSRCAGKGRKCRSTASLRKHCKKTRRGKRKSYCRTRHNRKHRMSLRHRGGRRRRRNSHRRRRRGGFVAELRRALVPYALYRAQKHMQHKRKHRRHHKKGGRRSRRRSNRRRNSHRRRRRSNRNRH